MVLSKLLVEASCVVSDPAPERIGWTDQHDFHALVCLAPGSGSTRSWMEYSSCLREE